MKNIEKVNLIEDQLLAKNIDEYDIYLVNSNLYETQLLKDKIDYDRVAEKFGYFIRILNQHKDETGIGVVNGNSLDKKNIISNIESCQYLSKLNRGSKYYFPNRKQYKEVPTAEKEIIENPEKIIKRYSEELMKEVTALNEVEPTFSRLRLHIDNLFLRNHNGIDMNSKSTYFFIEFAVKSQKGEKLSEFWDVGYIKNASNLNLRARIKEWASYAKDNLKAKIPQAEKEAIVIFSPQLLRDALNSVLGFHSSGESYHNKTSAYKLDEKVADERFTIYDNGLLKGGLKSNPWDGEGNPHQKTVLIDKGIFKNRIFDQKYGILAEEKSTGNGIRTTNGTISNSISNLEIEPGNIKLSDMISEINQGYYIMKCSWLNPDDASGNFGAEIRNGYFIKNGKLESPIKGGNLSGNVLKMLENCKFISKERKYVENSLFPYVAFTNMTISS